MDYLTFLVAVLHAHRALCQEMLWDTTVKLAENMTLECIYPSMDSLTQMEWLKINTTNKESIAIFSPRHGAVIRELYADRVSFMNSTASPNDMNLYFHNASRTDVGFYCCSLLTFPYGHWEKIIQVVSIDGFEIVESPNSHVVSAPGKNVTLSCPLPEKRPIEKVTWEKIQPHQIDLLTSCNLSQGRNYVSKYPRELWSPCSTGMQKSSIVLPHVLISDSGLYQCEFQALEAENTTCVIRLMVISGNNDSLYILFIAGGTIILLVLIILISLAIVLSFNRRQRQKKILFEKSWETQNKIREMNRLMPSVSSLQETNNRSPTTPNQLLDGAKEDIYVNYPNFSRRPKTRV